MKDNKSKEMYLQKSHQEEKYHYNNPNDIITDEINPTTKSGYRSIYSSEKQSKDVPAANTDFGKPASTKQSRVVKEEQEIKK